MEAIKLTAVGKVDSEGKDYYFTCPKLPCQVDLSKVVIFVHPWEDDTGGIGADIVIKPYSKEEQRASK